MTDGINNKADLKESIVSKILSVFANVPPQRDIMIFVDDVLAEAKVRLEEMAKTSRAAYYEDIFNERVERLRTLGCPAFILKKLETKNDGKIFDGVYFILDIDDGANTEKMTCAEADERIRGKNRFPLTVDEIIALLLQRTEPLSCNLLASGSRYEHDDKVPVCTTEDNKIWLKTCFYKSIHPNSITPSCGSRI